MNRHSEQRLHSLVVQEGDFVVRSLRNLGVVGGELDDCVQKVFLAAAKRLDDIEEGKERAFLFGCAQNTAAHFRRSLARRREVPEEEVEEQSSAATSPEMLTARKQSREMLDRILNSMEDSMRSVFVLHAFEEMTMAEISQLLEIPPGTVASRLRRARELFKHELLTIQAADKQETA